MSVVGIDLGTTNTVVASVRAGKVHVLADKEGMRLLPSIVSFHPNGGVLVGAAARARRVIDPRNTVYSHKRLIGRSWNSPEIAQARRRVAFELREGRGQGSLVHARGQDFTLPEISAFVLKRARQIAEQALGTPVERAVITVPAHFNELQRSSTKVAGRVSGLEVLRILNEPTAAALAYGLGRSGNERVAVYDFGGGTFDCTLLDLNGNVFEVLATAGDSFLGGDDVDALIADRMAEAFLKQHRQDARQAPEMHERLKLAAEEIKVALSTAEAHAVTLEEFGHGAGGASLRFHFSMTRRDLESLLAPLVDRTFKVTEDALALARLAPTSFDKVILVGGSTRIPLVRRRVEAFFGGPTMDRVNPDEVVAIGAAIQAAALTEGARRRSIPAAPPVLGRAPQGELRDDTYTSELGAETLPDRSAPPSTSKAAFASEPPSFGFQPGSGGRAGSFPDLSPPTPFEWSPASAGAAPASSGAPDSKRAPLLAHGAPPPAAAKAKPARKPGERTPNRRITAPTMSGTAPSPITPQPFGPMEKIEPAAPAAPARPVAAPPGSATARMPDAFMQPPAAPPATARMPDAFMQPPAAPPAYAPPAAPPQAAAPPPLPGWAPPSPIASPDAPPSQPPIFGAFPSAPPPGNAPSQPPIFGAFPSAPPLDPAHAGTFAAGVIPAAPPAPQHLEYRAPVLVDVTPRALVVETAGGYTNTIIPRNAKIPSERTRRFSTGRDMQTTVRVRVAQGESPGFDQNTFLGEVELSGLRPAVRGAVTIAVTFEVDADGTLRVRARDVDTGTEARATLQLVGIADESSVVMMINRFADWSDLGGG